MSRFHPIPGGTGLLLLPDLDANPPREERVVKPAQRKEGRRARV